jgi:hypothetical protein
MEQMVTAIKGQYRSREEAEVEMPVRAALVVVLGVVEVAETGVGAELILLSSCIMIAMEEPLGSTMTDMVDDERRE